MARTLDENPYKDMDLEQKNVQENIAARMHGVNLETEDMLKQTGGMPPEMDWRDYAREEEENSKWEVPMPAKYKIFGFNKVEVGSNVRVRARGQLRRRRIRRGLR